MLAQFSDCFKKPSGNSLYNNKLNVEQLTKNSYYETFMSTNCHTVQGQNRKYLRMTFTSSGANYTAKSKLPTAATATLPRKNYECPKKLPGFFQQRNSRTFKRNNRHSSKLQQQRHSKFLLFAKNSRLFGFEPIVSPLKRTRRSKQALTRALCSSNQSQYCQKGKQK